MVMLGAIEDGVVGKVVNGYKLGMGDLIRGENWLGENPICEAEDRSAICFLMVLFLGPRSCWTASLFIPTSIHLLSRHPRH